MRYTQFSLLAILAVTLCAPTWGQVTTATFYGIVKDTSGAVVPGATVTLTHLETNAAVKKTTDAVGEFQFDFLRVGTYRLEIEASGFKRHQTPGIGLAGGQTIRQSYVLEVGAVAETVTVEGQAPLVSTASSEQFQTVEQFKVKELPLARRNVTNVLRLTTGVDQGASRSPRINGVGSAGTGVSVDGTDANPQPEQRGMSMYGGRNYVDVLSIDAVQEVQLVRGILPAEYGGVAGGQVNLLSKSGTNNWHGTAFENYQSHVLNARSPFVDRNTPKPRSVFNQFGGSLGGPVKHDKIFVFGTYEGYRESVTARQAGTVPSVSFREEMQRAYPVPEMKILLDHIPLPTLPFLQRDGTPHPDLGRFETLRNRPSRENHVVVKGDIRIGNLSNFSATYTRMRPFGLDLRDIPANDRTFQYVQDHARFSFTTARANWTSETRFGYNANDMVRLDQFFTVKDPRNIKELGPFGRSIPVFSISGLTGSLGDGELWRMEGETFTFDQKVSRHMGRHSFKYGGRFQWINGSRTNPENPKISFLTKDDFLAKVPSSLNFTFGSPPYESRIYEIGGFVQDDFRVDPKLVLNLGMRYDYFSNMAAEGSSDIPAGYYNLSPPKDFAKFDFGPRRDPKDPFHADGWVNLGPRFGFAYNPDGRGRMVVRGGYGVLFSSNMPGLLRQSVSHPEIPFRIIFSRADAARLGLKWPLYTDEARAVAEAEIARQGLRFQHSVFNPGFQNPYTMHYQLNVQRALSSTLMLETGYVGVRGVKFPLHRRYNEADRFTGQRPNPRIVPGGYYVDNTQNMAYNAWQTSLRKRFSRNVTFDAHYTWSKGLSTQGGDLGAYYGSDAIDSRIQEFNNLRAERGPNAGDAAHRFLADWIYNLPRLGKMHPLIRHTLGGWEVSGVFSARSGEPFNITQSCASSRHCRPDYIGAKVYLDNFKQTPSTFCVPGARCGIRYLNVAAFRRVPLAPTGIAERPGNIGQQAFRNPATWGMDMALAKNFRLRESMNLQMRADLFNALNHINYGGPSDSINSPTFGEINGASGTRVIQLNARLSW